MYPKKITAIILVISITLFSHNSIFAAQDPSVVQSIGFFQTTDPYLPFSNDLKKQKGNIGYLLGSIFWKLGETGYDASKKGKIKPDYIDYNGISAWNQIGSDVVLYATGNVGIGTNTPAYKLDVNGNLNATAIYENGTSLSSKYQSTISAGTTSQYYRGDKTWQTLNSSAVTEGTNLYFTNARSQAAITGGASSITTSNLTTNRALISDTSGKVGISSVTSTELGYISGVTSSIQTQLNTLSGTIGTKLGTFGIGTTNYISKFNGIGDLVNSQIYDNGSNVGIGTSSPIDKLDIRGNISFGNGDGSRIRFEDQGTFNRIAFNEIRFWDWQTGGDMITLNNGNVGIGTQNPLVALDINSSSSADPLVKMTGNGNIGVFKYANSGNYAYDQVFLGGIFKREFGWTDPAGGFYITRTQSQGNTNSDFYINSSGNVGIGTTTPSVKLEVAGNIKTNGFVFDGNDDTRLRLRDADNGNYKDLAVNKIYSAGNVYAGGGVTFGDGTVQTTAASGGGGGLGITMPNSTTCYHPGLYTTVTLTPQYVTVSGGKLKMLYSRTGGGGCRDYTYYAKAYHNGTSLEACIISTSTYVTDCGG